MKMDLTERERLRQRLNFPQPSPDDHPVHVPTSTPRAAESPSDDSSPAPETSDEPVDGSSDDVTTSATDEQPDLSVLSRLAEVIERLDDRIEGNRLELQRIAQRLDNIELTMQTVTVEGDELVGIEAVRRTVAASHRALTSQLTRMIDDVESRVLGQVGSGARVTSSSADDR